MIKTQTTLRTIAAIVLLTITFTSCKKDSNTTTPTTVSGSASANFRTATIPATDITFNSATFTNASGVVDIVATNAAGAKLTLHVTGVTGAGTYTLTGNNSGVFINGGVTYTTVGSGGGNVIITTLSADKAEGTFLVEAFSGTGTTAVYASLSSGKFTAGK